jgi:hypothetical protein
VALHGLSSTHVSALDFMTDGWLAIVCVFQLSVNNAGTEGLVRWCVNGWVGVYIGLVVWLFLVTYLLDTMSTVLRRV